ncbi:MAG: hypothetical protein LVR00_00275 [Rhabdochlamydiaceae bacterium]
MNISDWSVKQEGNNYASTGTAITVPGTVDPNTGLTPLEITNTGQAYPLSANPKSGFRVAIGLNLAYEAWELYTDYTHIGGTQKSSVSSDSLNTGILPLFAYTSNNGILASTTAFASSGGTGFVSSAKASWEFRYNNMNLELGKTIPLTRHTMLHPHFGLQGSWQSQNLKVQYNVSSTTNDALSIGSNRVHFKQTFWGVGPRIGLNSYWECCSHLGLFGDSAVALLWSKFNARSRSYDTNVANHYTDRLIANQRYRPNTLSPMAEVRLGAFFNWLFANLYRLQIQLSWEAQVWFSQNQHSSSIPDDNLILQGLNAGFRFDF